MVRAPVGRNPAARPRFFERRGVRCGHCDIERETPMDWNERTRRAFLKQFGAAGAVALAAANADRAGIATTGLCDATRAYSRRPKAGRHARHSHGVVARGKVWHVHPLGPLQRDRPARVGEGERGSSFVAVRVAGQTLSSQAQCRARMGSAGQDAPARSTW